MKNRIYIFTSLFLIFSAFTLLGGSLWKVNNKNMKIRFSAPSDPHQLSFSGIEAGIDFDTANLSSSEFNAIIDVKTLSTEDPDLTKNFLSADFLDADKYQYIKFMSTRIEKANKGFIVYGALAVKDSVHRVSIPFMFDQKGEEGSFKGSFSVFAGDYGVMKKSKSGSDKIDITLEIPVTKAK